MGNIRDILYQIQRAPVFLVTAIDLVFLCVLVFVFKTNCANELRSVIKDAFIGWNGALALSINIINKEASSIHTDVSDDGTTTTSIINSGDAPPPKS
jgi:hypothetical protein